jgi:hypothetical protein
MRIKKIVFEKSANSLLAKAEDCFDLAKTQHVETDAEHNIADTQLDSAARQKRIGMQQHEGADKPDASANKLDSVGNALVDNAVEIMGEIIIPQRE